MKYFSGGTTGASCGQRRQSDVFNNFCTKPKCTIVQMQIINGKCHPSWMANGNRKLIHMGVCICMCAYHIFNGSRKLHAYIFIYRDTLLYIHILHLRVHISKPLIWILQNGNGHWSQMIKFSFCNICTIVSMNSTNAPN